MKTNTRTLTHARTRKQTQPFTFKLYNSQMFVQLLQLLLEQVVLLTFNGEGNSVRQLKYKLFILELLLGRITLTVEVEPTLSVFHSIPYGDILEVAIKEPVIFMDLSINLVMAFNHSSIKDCITTMFLVLCVMLPLRTLSSCYQQETSVQVDGAGHTMDISWQNIMVIQEETCTCASTTTQNRQLEVLQTRMAIYFILLKEHVDHFLVLPT